MYASANWFSYDNSYSFSFLASPGAFTLAQIIIIFKYSIFSKKKKLIKFETENVCNSLKRNQNILKMLSCLKNAIFKENFMNIQ